MGIFSSGFEKNAITTARAFGLPQFRFAVVPESLTGLAPEQIERVATDALGRIVEVLTTQPEAEQESPSGAASGGTGRLKFEAPDSYAAAETMNRRFLESEWGDGFPLIPPTPEKVAWMLKGTTRSPSDIVTIMVPANGVATVEKIAVNAVMAGCEPVHLPILIAACEAFTGLGFQGRTLATSTSSHAPLMVINGPIAKEIGINAGRCALGPGFQSRHNIVLGRALRLIMINVGHCRPGRMDMDTIGSARKFGMCVAENEDESPWSPFHEERGFGRDQSTITIFATRDEIDVNDLGSWTPEGVLNSLAFYSAIPGGEYLVQVRPGDDPCYNHLLVMSPEHAKICGAAGWGKKAVREYVYQTCRISARRLLNRCRNQPDKIFPQWQWLLKLSDSELDQIMLPVMENANDIPILVVGGSTAKDMIYRCIARPSTVLIKDRA